MLRIVSKKKRLYHVHTASQHSELDNQVVVVITFSRISCTPGKRGEKLHSKGAGRLERYLALISE